MIRWVIAYGACQYGDGGKDPRFLLLEESLDDKFADVARSSDGNVLEFRHGSWMCLN
jgi:hypothetical protein